MDLTESIAPKSDQMNAEDLLSGPRTFTIKEVRKGGSAEQPVEVLLVEFPADRPFKPSKTVRRIMVAAWGVEAAAYVGHRMTLYRDPSVKWGGMDVGGIRVSHMSHIDRPLTLALTVTRGKRAPYVVQPLPDAAPTSAVVTAETLAELTEMFDEARIAKEQRLGGVNQITNGSATALETITEDQAQAAIAALRKRVGR